MLRAATLVPRFDLGIRDARASSCGYRFRRPRFGHSPAACASGRGLRRGLAFLAPPSRLRRPRLGSGWNSLAFARSPPPSAKRSAGFFAAFCRALLAACGGSALRASGGGARVFLFLA